MDAEIAEKIHVCTNHGNIQFKKHALVRSVERSIKIDEIVKVLQNCQIIAIYAEDKPLKSYLTFGFTKTKRPLHIVVALDETEKYVWIISAYEPDKKNWNETFTKRLKK